MNSREACPTKKTAPALPKRLQQAIEGASWAANAVDPVRATVVLVAFLALTAVGFYLQYRVVAWARTGARFRERRLVYGVLAFLLMHGLTLTLGGFVRPRRADLSRAIPANELDDFVRCMAVCFAVGPTLARAGTITRIRFTFGCRRGAAGRTTRLAHAAAGQSRSDREAHRHAPDRSRPVRSPGSRREDQHRQRRTRTRRGVSVRPCMSKEREHAVHQRRSETARRFVPSYHAVLQVETHRRQGEESHENDVARTGSTRSRP